MWSYQFVDRLNLFTGLCHMPSYNSYSALSGIHGINKLNLRTKPKGKVIISPT